MKRTCSTACSSEDDGVLEIKNIAISQEVHGKNCGRTLIQAGVQLNFSYIGLSISMGLFLMTKKIPCARRVVQLLVGLYMLVYLGLMCNENMQIEGFWYYLFAGVFEEDYYSSDTITGYTQTSFDIENKTVISERMHSDSSISAKKYSFEFGENPGQLIVSFVAVKGESYCEDKNKWYTKDELLYSVPSVTQMLAAEADGTVFEYSIMKTDYSAENARKTYPNGAAIHAAAVYDSTKGWFDQCGTYRISIDDGENFIIYCRNGSEIYWKDSEIEGTYNENHTVFTSSNGGTYELSDVKDEQSVIVGDGDRTCWLNFEGMSL